MDALPYAVSSGQSVHLQDPSKRGGHSSVCMHVGIGYGGQFWDRTEGISGFQLYISLWHLQVFFCTVQTCPTVSESEKRQPEHTGITVPSERKRWMFSGVGLKRAVPQKDLCCVCCRTWKAFRAFEWGTWKESRTSECSWTWLCHTARGRQDLISQLP